MSDLFSQPLGFYVIGIPLFLVGLVIALALVTLCVWCAVVIVEMWVEWIQIMKRRLFK